MSANAVRDTINRQADAQTHAFFNVLRDRGAVRIPEVIHMAMLVGYVTGIEVGVAMGAAYPERVVALREHFDSIHDPKAVHETNADILEILEAFDEPGA